MVHRGAKILPEVVDKGNYWLQNSVKKLKRVQKIDCLGSRALSSHSVFFYKAAVSLRSDCVPAAVSGAGSVKPGRMAVERLRKPKMAKSAKKQHFGGGFAALDGLTKRRIFAKPA